jgi:hypothetical protein
MGKQRCRQKQGQGCSADVVDMLTDASPSQNLPRMNGTYGAFSLLAPRKGYLQRIGDVYQNRTLEQVLHTAQYSDGLVCVVAEVLVHT